MKISSSAKFRKWLPWLTYKTSKNKIFQENLNDKVVFYAATNATKGSWTGTYYGPISSPKKHYYDVDWSANWLEWTSLSITPKFAKISLSLNQSRFVTNTYSVAKNVIKLYKNNKNELSVYFDSQTKTLVGKLADLERNNSFNNFNNKKEEGFIKLFNEILN